MGASGRRWWPTVGAVATGILVAVPYNYAGFYPLTWVAFVPLLLAVHGRSRAAHYGLGLLAGLSMYLVATPWMVEFLQRLKDYSLAPAAAGAVVFWLLTAQLPAFLMLVWRWSQRFTGRLNLWLFPVLVMLFYGWFPVLFPLQLGESQSAFLPAIQGVDLLGVYGLDLMIGISNAVIAGGLLNARGRLRDGGRDARAASAVSVLLLGVWLGYGWWSLDHWDRQADSWPTLSVGMVQSNEIPSASVPAPEPGYSRAWPPEMDLSQQLADAGADVIVWPETRYKGYFELDHVAGAFQRNMARLDVPLIFHDAEQEGSGQDFREYNASAFIDSGNLARVYRKHRLVAFGETLPLSREFPQLTDWTQQYLGDFFANLTPGTERVTFPVDGVQLVPAICYESAFPGHVARSVTVASESPLLVVMSNNGWFGNSRQPWQHAGATVLRAVENRVGLVHVINNGPSTAVSPSGRILASTPFGERIGLIAEVPYPAGTTWAPPLFSHWPEWFAITVGLLALVVLVLLRLKSPSH